MIVPCDVCGVDAAAKVTFRPNGRAFAYCVVHLSPLDVDGRWTIGPRRPRPAVEVEWL